MATSESSNYNTTRDDIIKRALRIIGALGQGETPVAAALTEGAQALNDILKEWASDGMHLWKYGAMALTPVSGQYYISIGDSSFYAHLKITDVYRRTGTGTSQLDVPLIKLSQQEWDAIPNKGLTGTPTHWTYYKSNTIQTGVPPGQTNYLFLWPTPDDTFVNSNAYIMARSMVALEDFDASTDTPDIPPHMINALVWALADQLSYEYGVPIAERAQINKKAMTHRALALSFDQEEGSLFLRPAPNWGSW